MQQLLTENHLRWDSLGEFLALAVSLEDFARKHDNAGAKVIAAALDKANGEFLNTNKSPSRKVGELDTRGSHFYLGLYWAQALAEQDDDAELKALFTPVAQALSENDWGRGLALVINEAIPANRSQAGDKWLYPSQQTTAPHTVDRVSLFLTFA